MFGSNNTNSGMNNNVTNRGAANNTNQRFGTSSFNSMNSAGNRSTTSNWQANQTPSSQNRNYSTTTNQQYNNNGSTESLFTSVFTQTANIGTLDPSGDENQLNRQFVQSANLIAQFYTSSLLAYRKSYQQGVKKSFRRLSSLLLQYSNQQQSQNAQIPINLVLTMMNQVLQEELAANTTNNNNGNNNNNTNNSSINTNNNNSNNQMNSEPINSSIMNHNVEMSPPNRASTTSPMSSLSVHNSIHSNGNSPQHTNKNDDAMPSSPTTTTTINSAIILNSDPLSNNNNNNNATNSCTITTMSNDSQQSTESLSNPPSSNSLNINQGIAPIMNTTTIANNQQQGMHTNNNTMTISSSPFAFPFQFNPLPNLPNTTNSNSGPFDFSSIPTDFSFANALLSGTVTTQHLTNTNHHPHHSLYHNSPSSGTRSSNHHHHHPHQHSQKISHQRTNFYNGSSFSSQNPLKRDIHMLNVPNNCIDEDDEDDAPRFLFRSINTTMNSTSSSNTVHNNTSTIGSGGGANMLINNGSNNSFISENTSLSPTPFSDHIPSSGQNTGDLSELSPLTQIFKKNRI